VTATDVFDDAASERVDGTGFAFTVGRCGAMDGWGEYAVIVGSASAALVGLLFVAVSIKVDVVVRSVALRARAAQTMTLFLVALLAAIILAIPALPLWVFGALVLALGVVAATVLIVLDRQAKRANDGASLARTLSAITPSAVVCVLVVVTGVAALFGWRGGVYFLAAATIGAITGGVINAWLFLVRLGD
jgi:hypothetical protein